MKKERNTTIMLATLTKLFEDFVTALKNSQRELFARADAERAEMYDLVGRMQETKKDIEDIGTFVSNIAATLVTTYADSTDLVGKIDDALEDPVGHCPSVPYNDLVEYCDACGAEIIVGDNYDYDSELDTYTCANCFEPLSEEIVEDVVED